MGSVAQKHYNMADVFMLIMRADLPRGVKHALNALLSFADFKDATGSFVYVDTAAKRAAWNPSAMREHIHKAVELGVLSRVSGGAGGAGVKVEYRFEVDKLREKTLQETDRLSDSKPSTKQTGFSEKPSTFRSENPAGFVPSLNNASLDAASDYPAKAPATRRSYQKKRYVVDDDASLSEREADVYYVFKDLWSEDMGRAYEPRPSDVRKLREFFKIADAGGYNEDLCCYAVGEYFGSTDEFYRKRGFPLALFATHADRFLAAVKDTR
jgi:hypothetical protein